MKKINLFTITMAIMIMIGCSSTTVEADLFKQELNLNPTGVYYVDPSVKYHDITYYNNTEINSIYSISVCPLGDDQYRFIMIDMVDSYIVIDTILAPAHQNYFSNFDDTLNNDIELVYLNYEEEYDRWILSNAGNKIPLTYDSYDYTILEKNDDHYSESLESGRYFIEDTFDYCLSIWYWADSAYPIFTYENVDGEMVNMMPSLRYDDYCTEYRCSNFSVYHFYDTPQVEIIYDDGESYFIEMLNDGCHSENIDIYSTTYKALYDIGNSVIVVEVELYLTEDDYGYDQLVYNIEYEDIILASGKAKICGAEGEWLVSKDFIYSLNNFQIQIPYIAPGFVECH